MDALERVLAALEERGCAPRGNDQRGYVALCPAHDDRNPSLSVGYGRERVLVHCHTGCPAQAVIDALALEWKDLFDGDHEFERGGRSRFAGDGGWCRR